MTYFDPYVLGCCVILAGGMWLAFNVSVAVLTLILMVLTASSMADVVLTASAVGFVLFGVRWGGQRLRRRLDGAYAESLTQMLYHPAEHLDEHVDEPCDPCPEIEVLLLERLKLKNGKAQCSRDDLPRWNANLQRVEEMIRRRR